MDINEQKNTTKNSLLPLTSLFHAEAIPILQELQNCICAESPSNSCDLDRKATTAILPLIVIPQWTCHPDVLEALKLLQSISPSSAQSSRTKALLVVIAALNHSLYMDDILTTIPNYSSQAPSLIVERVCLIHVTSEEISCYQKNPLLIKTALLMCLKLLFLSLSRNSKQDVLNLSFQLSKQNKKASSCFILETIVAVMISLWNQFTKRSYTQEVFFCIKVAQERMKTLLLEYRNSSQIIKHDSINLFQWTSSHLFNSGRNCLSYLLSMKLKKTAHEKCFILKQKIFIAALAQFFFLSIDSIEATFQLGVEVIHEDGWFEFPITKSTKIFGFASTLFRFILQSTFSNTSDVYIKIVPVLSMILENEAKELKQLYFNQCKKPSLVTVEKKKLLKESIILGISHFLSASAKFILKITNCIKKVDALNLPHKEVHSIAADILQWVFNVPDCMMESMYQFFVISLVESLMLRHEIWPFLAEVIGFIYSMNDLFQSLSLRQFKHWIVKSKETSLQQLQFSFSLFLCSKVPFGRHQVLQRLIESFPRTTGDDQRELLYKGLYLQTVNLNSIKKEKLSPMSIVLKYFTDKIDLFKNSEYSEGYRELFAKWGFLIIKNDMKSKPILGKEECRKLLLPLSKLLAPNCKEASKKHDRNTALAIIVLLGSILLGSNHSHLEEKYFTVPKCDLKLLQEGRVLFSQLRQYPDSEVQLHVLLVTSKLLQVDDLLVLNLLSEKRMLFDHSYHDWDIKKRSTCNSFEQLEAVNYLTKIVKGSIKSDSDKGFRDSDQVYALKCSILQYLQRHFFVNQNVVRWISKRLRKNRKDSKMKSMSPTISKADDNFQPTPTAVHEENNTKEVCESEAKFKTTFEPTITLAENPFHSTQNDSILYSHQTVSKPKSSYKAPAPFKTRQSSKSSTGYDSDISSIKMMGNANFEQETVPSYTNILNGKESLDLQETRDCSVVEPITNNGKKPRFPVKGERLRQVMEGIFRKIQNDETADPTFSLHPLVFEVFLLDPNLFLQFCSSKSYFNASAHSYLSIPNLGASFSIMESYYWNQLVQDIKDSILLNLSDVLYRTERCLGSPLSLGQGMVLMQDQLAL